MNTQLKPSTEQFSAFPDSPPHLSEAPPPKVHKTTTVMNPRNYFRNSINPRELWNYRELLLYLSWRDVKVRYKQAALGAAWAIIQPVTAVLTFTLFFGKLAKMPSDGVPYPVFSFLAMLPWTYFTGALSKGGNSLVASSSLLSKVYFPRIFIPAAAVATGLVDYAISFGILLCLMGYYGFVPSVAWLITVPLLTLLMIFFALGVSLWLSSLNVQYRDVGHVIPFFLQMWMFATPILYPLSLVPDRFLWLARLNPMTGIIEGFRSVLPGRSFDLPSLAFSVVAVAIIFTTGLIYFSRVERTFADVV